MNPLIYIIVLLYFISTLAYLGYLFIQKDMIHKWGYYFLWAGFLCHFFLIGGEAVKLSSLPVYNLHQTLSLAGWIIAGVFLLLYLKFGLKILGIFTAPLVTFIMIMSLSFPDSPAKVHQAFKSFWIIIHIIIIFAGEAAFAMACGVGILYLVQEHAIKTKKRGFFYKRLPSLEFLDTMGYTCIISGFTMLTIGLIGGFLYAKTIWGRFWSWDPKEVWSGIMWLFYAALLHERLAVGWRGRKSAIMSIVGFLVLIFTFLGVNFLLKGHHGEFTRW